MTNKEEFYGIINTYVKRDGINQLLDWLEKSDYFIAPASSRFHLASDGGLLQHSLNVYRRLKKLYEQEYGEIPDIKHETLAIIALFHDLCKVNYYKKEWKNVKVYSDKGSKSDNGGRFDWETKQGYSVEEKCVFGYHGAKSAFLIERFIKLTPEEYICVANHMGAYDRPQNDYSISKVFEQNTLAFLLHTADCFASFVDEKE